MDIKSIVGALPLPLIAWGSIIGGLILLTHVAVKISRQGGCGTTIIWLFITGISGLLGWALSYGFAFVASILETDLGPILGPIENLLFIYYGAFCGMAVQGIVSGLRGKGYKVEVGD